MKVAHLSAVRHGEQARLQVLEVKVLVGKRGAGIDGHAPRPVTVHKISSYINQKK